MLSAATAAKKPDAGLVRRRTWIENTYHRRRPEHTFGRLTPTEFEILQQAAHVA